MDDPVDAVLDDHRLQAGCVEDVDVGEAAASAAVHCRWLDDVRHDDVVVTVASPEFGG